MSNVIDYYRGVREGDSGAEPDAVGNILSDVLGILVSTSQQPDRTGSGAGVSVSHTPAADHVTGGDKRQRTRKKVGKKKTRKHLSFIRKIRRKYRHSLFKLKRRIRTRVRLTTKTIFQH